MDAHGDLPPPSGPELSAPLTVWAPVAAPAGAWSAGGILEFVDAPLVQYQLLDEGEPERVPVLDDLIGVNLQGRSTLHERVTVGAAVPVWFRSTGLDGGQGPALGDLQVWAPVGVLLPDLETGTGFGVSAVPWFRLHTGAQNRFLGDPAPTAGLTGVGGLRTTRASASANLGVSGTGIAEFDNQVLGGGRLHWGLAGGVRVATSLWVHLEARGGLSLAPQSAVALDTVREVDTSGVRTPAELLLTVRGARDDGGWGVGSVGTGVSGGVGAANFRALAGLGTSYTPHVGPEPVYVPEFTFRVTDPTGVPVVGARVLAGDKELGTTSGDGTVGTDEPKWSREVRVQARGFAEEVVPRPTDLMADSAHVVLEWIPIPIPLRVQDQEGAPVPAELVATSLDDPEAEPVTGTVGALELPPGAWRVELRAEGFGLQAREIAVPDGGRAPMETEVVLLADEGGEAVLVQRITDPDGEAVAGARVLVDGVPVGTSGEGGLVEVHSLPEGEHEVEILHEAFTTSGAAVVLEPGDNPQALALRRVPGSVRVVARGPNGGVVPDAVVRFDGPRRLAAAPLGDRGERLQVLGPGTWQVFLTSSEYGIQQREVVVPEDSYELIVVEVVLRPGEEGAAELALRVIDPDGVPVDGAEVRIDGQSYGTTSTGGLVRVANLAPGARTLEVGGADFRSAQPRDLLLFEGLQEEVFTLQWKPGSVRVRTRSPEGPVSDAFVRFAGPVSMRPAPLGPSGDSLFSLPAGEWVALVTSETHGLQQRELTLEEDSARLHTVDVVLNPGEGGLANLALRVVDDEGQPVAGAEVALDGAALGRTTNSGRLTLTELSVGSRELSVRAPLFRDAVRSVRLLEGDQDLEETLEWGAGSVRVTVHRPDDTPVHDAVVRLLGAERTAPSQVDAFGERMFQLAPGKWQVLVTSETAGLAQQALEVPEESDELVTVAFVMRPVTTGQAALLVRVVDPKGTPIPDARIRLGRDDAGVTGDGGALLIEDLPPGPVVVDVSAPHHLGIDDRRIRLREGSQERIVVLDWLPGTVNVTAQDADGVPLDATLRAVGPVDAAPVQTGPDGHEVLTLQPGTWQIVASTHDMGPARASIDVVHGDKPLEVVLVLEPTRVEVTAEAVVIKERVQFDFGQATLRADSDAVLVEVANTLLSRTEVLRVEVQGHTDNVGEVPYNQELSQRRAEAVVSDLVARGVPPEKLVARGYGLQRPLQPNDTEEGRAANRRVAFEIAEQSASE